MKLFNSLLVAACVAGLSVEAFGQIREAVRAGTSGAAATSAGVIANGVSGAAQGANGVASGARAGTQGTATMTNLLSEAGFDANSAPKVLMCDPGAMALLPQQLRIAVARATEMGVGSQGCLARFSDEGDAGVPIAAATLQQAMVAVMDSMRIKHISEASASQKQRVFDAAIDSLAKQFGEARTAALARAGQLCMGCDVMDPVVCGAGGLQATAAVAN